MEEDRDRGLGKMRVWAGSGSRVFPPFSKYEGALHSSPLFWMMLLCLWAFPLLQQ